jgi:hypothetical protein
MYVVTRLNCDTNDTTIVYISDKDPSENPFIISYEKLIDDVDVYRLKNTDICTDIKVITKERIEVFDRGYISGKTLKFVYQIQEYPEEDDDE